MLCRRARPVVLAAPLPQVPLQPRAAAVRQRVAVARRQHRPARPLRLHRRRAAGDRPFPLPSSPTARDTGRPWVARDFINIHDGYLEHPDLIQQFVNDVGFTSTATQYAIRVVCLYFMSNYTR